MPIPSSSAVTAAEADQDKIVLRRMQDGVNELKRMGKVPAQARQIILNLNGDKLERWDQIGFSGCCK